MGKLAIQYAKLPETKRNLILQIQRTKSSQLMKTPADRILFLQRNIGNQAVQRLIKSGTLQAKLKIGQPGDKYEQEADRVADAVMRMPEPQAVSSDTLSIQGTCPACEEDELRRQPIEEEEEEELLQTKEISGQHAETRPDLESRINAIRGGGQPLAESERSFFEPHFGRDFSQVRVHTDAAAAESARAVNARAFTMGQDVVFAAGEYAPETEVGRQLQAHELMHVMQQRHGFNSVIQLQPEDCTPRITGVAPPRNPTQEVTEAHNLAVVYVGVALRQVEALQRGGYVPIMVRPSLNYHFGTPNPTQLTTITNRFGAINRRLSQGTDIYRCNTDRYCRAYARQMCPAGGARARICPDFFQVGVVARAIFLVHEATHAAGACGDVHHQDPGYPGSNPANNAYSYERFTLDMALMLGPPIPLRPHRSHVPTGPQ